MITWQSSLKYFLPEPCTFPLDKVQGEMMSAAGRFWKWYRTGSKMTENDFTQSGSTKAYLRSSKTAQKVPPDTQTLISVILSEPK